MYFQYVSYIVRHHGLNYHVYADDVQIYISFNINVPGNAACVIFKITSCVEELSVWLIKKCLSLMTQRLSISLRHPLTI